MYTVSLCFVLCLALSLCSCCSLQPDIAYDNLGMPLLDYYPNGQQEDIYARNVWDIAAYQGDIYIGSGDGNANKGPVPLMRYTPQGQWEEASVLPDQQIQRFRPMEDQLLIPGTDPTDDWSLGNYYTVKSDRTVSIHRVLPNGMHCNDMVEFDGRLFAALETELGNSPIVVSDDGGDTFTPLPLIKDGSVVDTSRASESSGLSILCL